MFKLSPKVTAFMELFRNNGYQIYIVGGPVRDMVLGNEVKNWDFATDATPEQMQKMLPDSFYHNTYGTVTTMIDDMPFEVTPFRKESEYSDNRHPDTIEWAKTVEEDLSRRDFSINAMAYDGNILTDIFNGQKDLENKLIVAVGESDKRFQEDALRLLRAVRFASQLGFTIETKTLESLKRNSQLIQNISGERIRDEFLKIASSDHAAEGVILLKDSGLLKYILPEVDICFEVEQKSPNRHHIDDVGTHLVKSLAACPSKDPIVRFATLIHDIGKYKTYRKDEKTQMITFYNHEVVGTYQAKKIAERFKLSKKDTEKLIRLVQYHQFTVSEDQGDKAVRRFIREVGKEYIQDMLDLRTADRIGSGATPTSWRHELFKKRLEEVQKEPFKVTDLKISGQDVMEVLKINPGPKVGEVLNKLFNEVIEGKLKNERDQLLKGVNTYK
ncbi:MAG: CCA tRNA nucleotidyltransferase [Patescibacteria group bacterium]